MADLTKETVERAHSKPRLKIFWIPKVYIDAVASKETPLLKSDKAIFAFYLLFILYLYAGYDFLSPNATIHTKDYLLGITVVYGFLIPFILLRQTWAIALALIFFTIDRFQLIISNFMPITNYFLWVIGWLFGSTAIRVELARSRRRKAGLTETDTNDETHIYWYKKLIWVPNKLIEKSVTNYSSNPFAKSSRASFAILLFGFAAGIFITTVSKHPSGDHNLMIGIMLTYLVLIPFILRGKIIAMMTAIFIITLLRLYRFLPPHHVLPIFEIALCITSWRLALTSIRVELLRRHSNRTI